MIPLQTTDQLVVGSAQLVGLAVLAGTLGALVTVTYRWYTRETVPLGLALLTGLAGVAVYLIVTAPLDQLTESELSTLGEALYNIAAFTISAGGAAGGHRFGDGFGQDVLFGDPVEDVEQEVSTLAETVGRVTTVDLPDSIDDVVGYDPVSPETKDALAGKQFVFPQKLTQEELDERLRSRLRSDYGVGTVDLELGAEGSVEHLAVGSRAAGIGPTLPPATNAVAIRADPAFNASTGDIVQVWEADSMRRVLTGELRGIAGDVVTVAINSGDTPKIDPTREYRLVTLPVEDRPAREFASLLRAAEETFTEVTIEAGSPLHGLPVGALTSTIASVRPEDREPVPLPTREYVLSPGDLAFAIGTPDLLRKLEQAAKPLDPAVVSKTSTPAQTDDDIASGADEKPPSEDTSTDDSVTAEEAMPESEPASSAGHSDEAVSDQSSGPAPTQPDSPAPTQAESTPTASDDSDEPTPATAGKADETSFDELKAEYESSGGFDDDEDTEEDDDTKESDDTEPIEQLAGGSDDSDDDGDSGGASFDELKEEFESGEADWEEDESATSDDGEMTAPSDAGTEASGGSHEDNDDLVSLDEADISFDEDDDGDELEEAGFEESLDDGLDDEGLGGPGESGDDDGLGGGLGGGETDGIDEGLGGDIDDGLGGGDDLSALDVDEADDLSEIDADDDGDGLFDDDPFDDDDLFDGDEESLDMEDEEADDHAEDDVDDDDEDESEDEDEADDDTDDSDDSGGSSFAQLKEEFESGDADWEDDVSDSPGGDMRLDE
jgi:hypothetical protein